MTDITVRLRASEIFLSLEFLEKLLLATAIPIWLGLLVWSAWINLNELYVIFLVIYTALLVLLFVVRYVKRTPVVSQVGFLMFFGVPTISLLIYAIFIA